MELRPIGKYEARVPLIINGSNGARLVVGDAQLVDAHTMIIRVVSSNIQELFLHPLKSFTIHSEEG